MTDEEAHPEHGTRAQRERSEALGAYEADIESLRRRVSSVEDAAKQTEADRLGRAALLMHMVREPARSLIGADSTPRFYFIKNM